ncbi:MAG: galactose/glucose ABC transporter substrate-binding protein MglB [Treponema sp.]|jgi:methyl-galactoside transport system substrate-binding protein|nr:galactose/glucose ABC transporter substrate-binding protein MglB [Treponema sp.]
MKKVSIIVLAVMLSALCVPLFAGGTAESGSGLPAIGVAIYKFDDTFMSYTRNAIEQNAQGKAAVTTVDSQNAQPTQNDQVDQFISKKMKAIAINPVDRTAAGAIIDKAKAGNVPVVFFNREPFAEDMAKWDKVYYVGAKAEESGTMQGEIAAEYWKANPGADKNKDGVLQYIMLKGEPGHQDAELRTEFSIKAVTAAGIKVELLAEDTAMWDRPRAVEKMDAFWARFGDRIEVVFCNNDDMALGVIESLRKAGFFTGGKYLPVVGVDATAPALQALAEGTLLGTVLNDAKNQGKATFDLAYALASGTNPAGAGWTITDAKYVWVPYQKVTRDNYKDFQ